MASVPVKCLHLLNVFVLDVAEAAGTGDAMNQDGICCVMIYDCDIPDVRHPVQVHAVVVVRTLLRLLDHELPDELLKCCIVQIFRVVPQNFMLVC